MPEVNSEVLSPWMRKVLTHFKPFLKLSSYEVHFDQAGKGGRLKLHLDLSERAAEEAGLLK